MQVANDSAKDNSRGSPSFTGVEPERSLDARAADFIRAHSLIAPGDKVLTAVSAGLDSMVLLEVLFRLSCRLKFSLAAACFDHGLRGAQTLQEVALIRARCAALGIPFVSARADPALTEHGPGGKSLQAAARAARYAFLWENADRLGCRRLATGHHRDDQAETVLMRLLKGSGLAGLAAIRPSSLSGRLIRPLLEIRKSHLEQFARDNAVPWIEDPSNLTDKYLRNRLRRRLIPHIEKTYDPAFSENLALLAEEAAGLRLLLDGKVEALGQGGILREAGGCLAILCPEAAELPGLVRRRLIAGGVFRMTGGKLILSGRPLTSLEHLILRGPSGHGIDLPGGLCARREFESLMIGPKERPAKDFSGKDQALAIPGKTTVNLGRLSWEITSAESAGLSGKFSLPEEHALRGAFCEFFDLDRLELPLCAGRRRPGERIRPFGLKGEKKLKKVFLEKRVGQSRREEIPVIREASGRALWVCGIVRSEVAPVSSRTVRVLELTARDRSFQEQGGAGRETIIDT